MAVDMMKLVLACLISEYDVQCMDKRPQNTAMLNVLLPPTRAEISIRYRSLE